MPSPPSPPWPSLLRRLLVAAHVLAALALFSLRLTASRPPSHTLLSLWLGLGCAQIFLAAIWAVLRPAAWRWRLAAVAAPTLAWIWNNGRARDGDYDTWVAFFLPVAASAAACAVAMRLVNGCQLISAEELAEQHGAASRQFSLRTLMLLTAAVAVLCAVLEFLVHPWLEYGNEMLPFLAATSLSGSATLLAWFRTDRYGVQRAVSCFVAIAAGTTLRLIESPIDLRFALLLSSVECLALAITYQTWRASGLLLSGRTRV